ncbi:MAG: hypothetical protein J6W10_09185, partial [Kiritimatiellae bacterium]|nr:hypothetical protein [Kiritimatiellia bacterium]
MKRNIVLSVLTTLAVSAVSGAVRELTVSVDGLSPAQAVENIRVAKLKGDKSAWTVHVKNGVYNLKKPLVFTPADSGSPEAPVKWIG